MECLLKEIRILINNTISEICDKEFIDILYKKLDLNSLQDAILEDLIAFSLKDPASKGNPRNIIYGYTSFAAVMFYRLANEILRINTNSLLFQHKKYQYALSISAKGKLLSGAEINPYAKIGKRFILDHGMGTVIGETAEIGDDVYILGGVILGAKQISNNPNEPRHPKIGNNVQIGSYSRLFGRINIGNNVFIGSHCTIVDDIPENHIVTLKTENQIIRNKL